MNYETVPLERVATLLSGGTPSKSKPEYWAGDIPWLTPKDMAQWVGKTDDAVSAKAIGNGTRLAPPHTSFVAVRGMSLHTEIRIVRSDRPLTFNQDIKAVVANEEVDPTFLYYALTARRQQLLDWVSAAGHGTGVLATDRLKSVPIPDLGLRDQRALATILSALDDKIELNRRMNETLEAMAQAIFRDWFVDFGPVRRKLAGSADPIAIMGGVTVDPAMAAELAELFPSTLNNDGLPNGFEFVTLGDAVAVLETGTRPKGGVKNIKAGVPSIGAESVLGLAKFDFSKTKYVPLDFFNSMRRGVLGERDVLLYKDGGRPGEFEPHVAMFGAGFPFSQCCINEHVYRVVAAAPFSQEFLYLHLTSEGSTDEMRNKGTGVAIPGLNSAAANSLSILDPGAKLLAAFTSLVRPLVDAALHGASENRTLAETRDYLLPRLMSGEVTVRSAMDMVEDAA